MPLKNKLIIFNISYKDSRIILVIVAIALAGAVWLARMAVVGPEPLNKEATLFLAFEKEGAGRRFQGEVVKGMTVLEALMASSEAGSIKFVYVTEKDNKVTIKKLDGYTDRLKKRLVFYINSTMVDARDINKIFVNPGDTIRVELQ